MLCWMRCDGAHVVVRLRRCRRQGLDACVQLGYMQVKYVGLKQRKRGCRSILSQLQTSTATQKWSRIYGVLTSSHPSRHESGIKASSICTKWCHHTPRPRFPLLPPLYTSLLYDDMYRPTFLPHGRTHVWPVRKRVPFIG